ncbi:MAG: inorganic diphosphatase [Candidatus Diapherotrites archaeon]|nr:inorganic diphosphatase [Candidatus Diapherotrites archaeon]
MFSPWHDVSFGKKAPQEVEAVIEVPKDSKLKYEIDKASGMLRLDRALYSAVHYPGDYGFIPRTYCEDNDPLDVIVISNFSTYPNTIVTVRPIGMIEMLDKNEKDDKIIAVHANDPRFTEIKSLKDIPSHILLETKHFFETYKYLQKVEVKIIQHRETKDAWKCIENAIQLYKKKFPERKYPE